MLASTVAKTCTRASGSDFREPRENVCQHLDKRRFSFQKNIPLGGGIDTRYLKRLRRAHNALYQGITIVC